MIRRPPRSTRTDTLFPYTTLFRSLPGPRARDDPPCARREGARVRTAALLRPARREFRLVAALLRTASGDERALPDHLHADGDGRDRFCLCADPQGGGVAARPLYGVARLRHGPDLPDRPAQSRRRNPCPPCLPVERRVGTACVGTFRSRVSP